MKFGILDLSSLIYPWWHRLDSELDSAGNGIHAVLRLLGYIHDLRGDHTHLVACVDRGHHHRNAIFPEYKAGREPPDPDLIRQLRLAERLCEALSVPVVQKAAYEGDDCIASLTRRLEERGKVQQIVIHSADGDLAQLVSDRTVMFTRRKGFYAVDDLIRDLGIYPTQVVCWKSLRGDPSDHVPGVPKCGPKLATALIQQYFDLDGVFANIEEIRKTPKIASFKGSTVAGYLEAGKESAYLSRELCRLVDDLDLGINAADTVLPQEQPNISKFLAELRDPTGDLQR